MSEKGAILKEMRALWRRNPAIFDEIAKEYCEKGSTVFPPDKRRRTYKNKDVLSWIWAHVEFLKWRDGIEHTTDVCERLAAHGMHFNVYADAHEGRWKVGREPEPQTFVYNAEGKAGKADGENIRKSYNDALKLEDLSLATLLLDEMKAAHAGSDSILGEDFIKKLPPPV